MTRQVGPGRSSWISSDPVDCLMEIVETVWNRMNQPDIETKTMRTTPPTDIEAFTLGLIMGIAMRHPRTRGQLELLETRARTNGGPR